MVHIAGVTAAASSILAAGIIAVIAAGPASAAPDRCKDVRISIKNQTGAAIRMVDIDYRDFGSKRWRSEFTSNRVLNHGKVWNTTRNLEGVNSANTFVRIQYQRLKSNGKWRLKKFNADSGTKICRTGSRFAVVIR